MTSRARAACFAVMLVTTAAGCGQTGPLTLPENARPIERVEQAAEPEQQQPTDDERQDER